MPMLMNKGRPAGFNGLPTWRCATKKIGSVTST